MNLCNFFLSTLLLVHGLVPNSDAPTITISGGGYSGTCTNQTYGITARLHLVLHEQEGSVSGNLELSEELSGGGPITGTLEGDQLTFTTSNSYCEITWFGRIQGKTIKGTYQARMADGSAQKGIWSARKG